MFTHILHDVVVCIWVASTRESTHPARVTDSSVHELLLLDSGMYSEGNHSTAEYFVPGQK